MSTLVIGKSIDENDTLWRYITLDVFIDLIDTNKLFFSPTAFYEKTDPFEGLLPEAGLKAFAGISDNYLSQMIKNREQLVKMLEDNSGVISDKNQKLMNEFDERIEDFRGHLRRSYPAIAKSGLVSCWYRNDHESEAMWRLYSKNGIAIRSSVSSIRKSIENNGENHIIHVAPVKYVDFYDKNLKPSDCVSDGYTIGVIKRASFSHENEIRFFMAGNIDIKNPENHIQHPLKVNINSSLLIERIYISPFSREPFKSSVRAICRKYGVCLNTVEDSKLLNGHQELLDTLIL